MHTQLTTYQQAMKTLEARAAQKAALQENLGWPAEPKRAMICIPMGASDAVGGNLLKEVLPGLLSLPVEILILGKGAREYGALFTKLQKEEQHRLAIIPQEEKMLRAMYAGADMALFLSDCTGQPELALCLRCGVVPVAPVTPTLENYNPNQETGNAFLYEQPTAWHCFVAIVRALETHRFPFDWKTIQRNGMEAQ